MECVKCGKKAKWISDKYISPLCDDCAVEETKRLVEENNELDEIGVGDWFNHLIEEESGLTTFVKE